MTIINIKEIIDYLPHRYPFLLVDRVLSYETGKSIVGLKNITFNEPFFTGHFPIQPIMPGVLIIEALAQVSGLLYFLITGTKASPTNFFYLAGVDKARFKRVVIPGDQLQLHSEFTRSRLDVWMFTVKATVNGELACSAELIIAKGALQ
jgi:3-hydroxyacyl-[acyl-carrier-protein] dehydratase